LKENRQAKSMTSLCLTLAQVPAGVPLLEGDDLSLCNGIPGHHNVTCVLLTSTDDSALPYSPNDVDVGMTDFDLNETMNITVAGREHFITGRCALSLQYMYDA
jgi:hypothetical protein